MAARSATAWSCVCACMRESHTDAPAAGDPAIWEPDLCPGLLVVRRGCVRRAQPGARACAPRAGVRRTRPARGASVAFARSRFTCPPARLPPIMPLRAPASCGREAGIGDGCAARGMRVSSQPRGARNALWAHRWSGARVTRLLSAGSCQPLCRSLAHRAPRAAFRPETAAPCMIDDSRSEIWRARVRGPYGSRISLGARELRIEASLVSLILPRSAQRPEGRRKRRSGAAVTQEPS